MKFICFILSLIALSCFVSAQNPTAAQIVAQFNLARSNRTHYISLLSTTYNNSNYGSSAQISAAITALNTTGTLSNVTEAQGLDYAAQIQANYLKAGWGSNPNTGCNGNNFTQRISAAGTWTVTAYEYLTGGYTTAEQIIASWLIGSPSVVLNSAFGSIGVGVSSSVTATPTVVVNLVGGFTCNSPCPAVPPIDSNSSLSYTCLTNTTTTNTTNTTNPTNTTNTTNPTNTTNTTNSTNTTNTTNSTNTTNTTNYKVPFPTNPAPIVTNLSGNLSCYQTAKSTLPSRAGVIAFINHARANPLEWITLIQANYTSSEFGTAADIANVTAFLNTTATCGPLTESQGLDVAAQHEANYIKQGWGASPHYGCNNTIVGGSAPWDRISAQGTWYTTCGENVVGGLSNPQDMVATWLIDSGVPDRGHRMNIFNCNYTLIGVGISSSTSPSYNPTVLTDFAGGFTCNTPCHSLPPMDVQFSCTTGYPICSSNASTGVNSNCTASLLP